MAKMKLQTQPNGSALCGQTSVAMIAGMPANDVILKAFGGHKKSTSGYQMKDALVKLGFSVIKFRKIDNRRKWELPKGKRGVMRIHPVGIRGGHAVAFDEDGKVYDPGPTNSQVFENVTEMLNYYKNNRIRKWRADWYYEVKFK